MLAADCLRLGVARALLRVLEVAHAQLPARPSPVVVLARSSCARVAQRRAEAGRHCRRAVPRCVACMPAAHARDIESWPLHVASCLREGPGGGGDDFGLCEADVSALCKQAGEATRSAHPAHSALTVRVSHAEHDSVLRAALLRYVQRKLFAADAQSQAAGAPHALALDGVARPQQLSVFAGVAAPQARRLRKAYCASRGCCCRSRHGRPPLQC